MTSIAHGTPSRGTARITLLGRASRLAAPVLLLLAIASVLTGCAASFNPQLTGADPSSAVGSFKGKLHGGQAPIYGAAIYVMQTGLSGYPFTESLSSVITNAPANTSIITSSGSGTFTGTVNGTSHGTYVLTDVNGNFTIPGFTCTPGAGVYIYSVGGEPIYGTPNNAATEMAAVGICPAGGASALATSVPFVNVNEVSTVAMAYALGGFEYPSFDASHISSSSTNTTGLANAFGTAAALYTVSTNNGANQSIPGQSSTTLITYQTINTLANIMSDCINSNGSTASSSTPCYILFQNATSNGISGGGTIPTDTASAMINIAHNVQSNVSTLYGLASNSYAPYTPALSSAPTNFGVGIFYQTSNLGNPVYAAFDGSGYLYVYSSASTAGVSANYLAKISPSSGIVGTISNADSSVFSIDQSNNIFFSSAGTNASSVREYASSTTATLGSLQNTFTYSGSNQLDHISVGPTNDLLITVHPIPFNASTAYVIDVPLVSGTYNLNSPTHTYGPTNTSDPRPLGTVTSASNVWLTDYNVNYITNFNGSTATKYTFPTTSDASTGMALTTHGNPIVVVNNANAFYSYDSPASPTRITGGGLSSAQTVTADGWSTFYFPSSNLCTVSIYAPGNSYDNSGWLYSSGLSVPNCGTSGSVGAPFALPDQSGNLWVGLQNNPSGSLQNGGVFEFVGIAAPTPQPLSYLQSLLPATRFDYRP